MGSSILNFNADEITDDVREKMKSKYLSNPDYTFEKVNRASLACGPLVKWAISQLMSADMLKHVEPLRYMKQKNQRQHRNVVYVCMMPAEGASKESLETRKAIFGSGELRLKSASHWPKYMTLQPEPGLKSKHIQVPEMPFPKLNERGKKLAGLL